MRLPSQLVAKSFLVVALAVVIYGLGALWLGWDGIQRQIYSFPKAYLVWMALLSLFNYLLRFWRWEIYLKKLGCPLPFTQSLGLYFSAYVMVITPGKVGEIFKAAIMKEKFGASLAIGLPIVLAERIYDFLAVLILACLGLFFWPGPFTGMTTGLVIAGSIPLLLVLFQNPKLRSILLRKLGKAPLLKNHNVALDESMDNLGKLLGPGPMAFSLALTTLAWMSECLGLWLACRGLGVEMPIPDATFVYAAGTLVGSLSFLPGGIGGTEAVIVMLLKSVAISGTTAATVALLIRAFTLWLAVVVGLIFYGIFRKSLFSASGQAQKGPTA